MLNVRRKYQYTPEMVEVIKQRYPTEPSRLIAKDLNVSIGSLNLFAKKHLGLEKCQEYLKSLDGDYFKLQEGRARARYANNTGQFNKGRASWNYRPVGTERLCPKYNIIKVKVSDSNWRPRAWLTWEKHQGKIPRGKIVWHKDGNPQNDDIENLELITRKEAMTRNSMQRFPPEIREVMHLKAEITKHLKKRSM